MSTPSQEDRLQAIEDRLAIYTLIASHPPSADTAAANYTREVYTEDGVFDRGPKLKGCRRHCILHLEAGAQGSDPRRACSLRRPAPHRPTRQ
jgi:SnoaL-like domain